MTDRERMIDVMADWHRMQYGTVPNYEILNKYADKLIEAGFGTVNVSFKKFREDVLYHGYHERWDRIREIVRRELE